MNTKGYSDGSKEAHLAYLMAGIGALGLLVDLGLSSAGARVISILLVFACAAAALSLGMLFAFLAIRRGAGIAPMQLFMSTWFPFLMGTTPLAGPVITVWKAVTLLKGKIGSATVVDHPGHSFYVPSSQSHSVQHYNAVDIKSLGKPAAAVLLIWATVQPIIALLILLLL